MTRDKTRRAIFLDRDGVLNQALIKEGKPFSPSSLEMISIPDDVPEALSKFKEAGFFLIVVTNQPDVARGRLKKEIVERINQHLQARLPLDEIIVCYHDDRDQCDCRKPQPGMILQGALAFSIDLSSSFVVGDRWKDIEAGRRAGCKTVFIDNGYLEEKPSPPADLTVISLKDAVPFLCGFAR